MPNIILISLFSVLIIAGGGSAYAQEPPQKAQLVTPPEAAPQPEVPKQISTVIIENNRLSVEFADISFQEILQSISKKAGFKVEGSSKVFSTKVTTKFNDLDIDSGIIRLFSIVKESNYLINYDPKGSISKIKVYSTVSGPVTGRTNSQIASPSSDTGTASPRARRSLRRRSQQMGTQGENTEQEATE